MKKQNPAWLDRSLLTGGYLALCLNAEEFAEVLRRMKIKKRDRPPFVSSWHAGATTHFAENRKLKMSASIVCLSVDPKATVEAVYALLVHEAVHVWQEQKRLFGMTSTCDEVEAYAVQTIAQTLMESYRERTA